MHVCGNYSAGKQVVRGFQATTVVYFLKMFVRNVPDYYSDLFLFIRPQNAYVVPTFYLLTMPVIRRHAIQPERRHLCAYEK